MSKQTSSSLSDTKALPPLPLGEGGLNGSEDRERRAASSTRRRRKRNPFSDQRRNNFPDINGVFKETMTSDFIAGDVGFHDNKDNIYGDCEDEEECIQNSDVDGLSVLNMSIGARAALNEHARFVAKFGIDGENIESEINCDSSSSDEKNSENGTNTMLDDQWERLLDLSRVASSVGGSVSEGIPSPPNSTTINIQIESSGTEKANTYEESSSIEVMTDVSHDFFNSSRVNLLITPERNQNRRKETVVTRDGARLNEVPFYETLISPFDSESKILSYDDENNEMDNYIDSDHCHAVERIASDEHGPSFNLGDISRISNNTYSDTNRTPDVSFYNYPTHDVRISDQKKDDGDFPFIATFDEECPSRILNNSSFLSFTGFSGPPRKSPDINLKQKSPSSSINTSGGKRFEKAQISTSGKQMMPTKSRSSEKEGHSSSSIQSTVSSFLAEAHTYAQQVANDVEKSIEGMESVTADFLRFAVEIGQTDAPSPISQVVSSPSTSHQDKMTKQQRTLENIQSACRNSSSSIETNVCNSTSESFRSSAMGGTIQFNLTGRKRYRTVVPRRVYLDLPIQHLNEEQDSFIAVQSNPEKTQMGECLLKSFEEIATHKTI